MSLDSAEENRAFAEKYRFPFPLVSDHDRSIALAWGAIDSPRDALARRIAYIIDGTGRIAAVHPKVSPATFPEEALTFVRSADVLG